jgi:polysaccharide chain length determinant protein (PEP-CTERM system associated)
MGAIFTLIRRSLKAAWRRRWLGVAIAWVICLGGWLVIHKLPDQYAASARLYVNTDAVLTPLLKGLAVDASPEAQLKVLQGTLVSRPNLETLISKTDLDLTVSGPTQRDALISRLASDIVVKPDTKLNLFSIQYSNSDPKLARDVVQTLLTIFIDSATGSDRRDMQNARIFLQHQIASYEQQLRVAEANRAEFRAKYPGLVIADNLSGTGEAAADPVEALQTKINQIDGNLQIKMALAAAYKKQLEGMQPTLQEGERGGPGSPTTLAQAEDKLRSLRLQYTDAFPGVISQEQLVAALKASPTHGGPGGRAAPNPAFEDLQLKLIDVAADAEAMKKQLTSMQSYRTKLQELQKDRPALIAQYEAITRGYTVLRRNYDDLLGRLQSANIGEAADTQADKVQIRVVDPPVIPRIPSGPNRLLLVSIVLGAGLAAGVAVPMLLAQLDRSFWVVEDLRSLGLPVLGGISLLTSIPWGRRLLAVTSFGIAVVVLISLYGGLMVRLLRATAIA